MKGFIEVTERENKLSIAVGHIRYIHHTKDLTIIRFGDSERMYVACDEDYETVKRMIEEAQEEY